MEKYSVFIDGGAGTTGLRIHQRLQEQEDIRVVTLPEEARKDFEARLNAVNNADISILCLPDAASAEIAAKASPHAKICDTSTAHRTASGWVYGMPELQGRRKSLQTATRVAVPGCHATGFIMLTAPLAAAGAFVKKQETPFVCTSLTGYSGGGKQMIAEYEAANRPAAYGSPRQYALGMSHKHLPEMSLYSGIGAPPLFTPVVADFYCGMLVSLPLRASWLTGEFKSRAALQKALAGYYAGEPLVTVYPPGENPFGATLAANGMAGKDGIELFVLGSDETPLLAARYDNLGKGASGAAVQCMNLLLGRKETTGLSL